MDLRRKLGQLNVGAKLLSDFRAMGWPSKEESLNKIAAEFGQNLCLVFSFDSFGHDGATDLVGQADQRANNQAIFIG